MKKIQFWTLHKKICHDMPPTYPRDSRRAGMWVSMITSSSSDDGISTRESERRESPEARGGPVEQDGLAGHGEEVMGSEAPNKRGINKY